MRAIELFSGIGGFRLACDARGISTVFANDVKPTACQVYADKFGKDELRMGDLNEYILQIPTHDLLTGGFPCQPFSSAGKKNGVRDPRGTLFESIIHILTIHRPRYFILENVKRLLSMEQGEHFATILDKLSTLGYFVEWRLLNAMNHGLSQNRQRVFITGVRNDGKVDKYRLIKESELEQLPAGVSSQIYNFNLWSMIVNHEKAFPGWGIAYNGKFCGFSLENFAEKTPLIPLDTILQKEASPEFDFTESTLSRINQNTIVNKVIQGVEIISNQSGGARMGYTIFGTKGVAPTLTASSSRHYERYKVGEKYRRLSNIEYARIQGFPDNHCEAISVYNQYELLGNAVPPIMVLWVLDSLLSEGITFRDLKNKKQLEIFDYAD